MVSDQTRNDIWWTFLQSERLARYYDALADNFRRKHRGTLLLLLAGAVGSTAAMLDLIPDRLQGVTEVLANAIIGIVAIWVFIADYAKKAAVADTISLECSRLHIEWESLWANVERMDEKEARRRHTDLGVKMDEATRPAGNADLVENRRLNEKTEALAYKLMEQRYAAT